MALTGLTRMADYGYGKEDTAGYVTGLEAVQQYLDAQKPPETPEKPFGMKPLAFAMVTALAVSMMALAIFLLATAIHFWKIWV